MHFAAWRSWLLPCFRHYVTEPGTSTLKDIPRNEDLSLRVAQARKIHTAIKFAWSAVLGADSFRRDQRWKEAGGDSLNVVEFWLYVEQKLGFKLPLDALDEDARPSTLAAALAAHLAGEVRTAEHSADRPLIYMMPAIQGDDPALARFRIGLGKEMRVKTIDYPEWRQMAARGDSFNAIVDAVYAAICREPRRDTYYLAGYSFGGLVAFEVAQRLKGSGRKVALLCLIDSRRWDLLPSDPSRKFHAFLGEPASRLRDPVKRMIASFVYRRRYRRLAAIERLLMLRPSKLSFWFKRQVTKEMRYRALREWQPMPLEVPTIFFLTQERWPGEPEDHGWQQLCSKLVTVPVAGSHDAVFQSPQGGLIKARLLAELRSAASRT